MEDLETFFLGKLSWLMKWMVSRVKKDNIFDQINIKRRSILMIKLNIVIIIFLCLTIPILA